MKTIVLAHQKVGVGKSAMDQQFDACVIDTSPSPDIRMISALALALASASASASAIVCIRPSS